MRTPISPWPSSAYLPVESVDGWIFHFEARSVRHQTYNADLPS